VSDRPFKYWNGYSWREHRPGFYGVDRSVASESLLGSALKYGGSVLTEELIQSGLDAMWKSGSRRPIVLVPSASASPDECLDEDGRPTHPGEPCVVGGPMANHAW
jgi:hypothetical protein